MKIELDTPKTLITLVSSLEKVFPDQTDYSELQSLNAFRGERIHFQVVMFMNSHEHEAELTLDGRLAQYATTFEVGYVPCFAPGAQADPDLLRRAPGLFPGPLLPATTLNLPDSCTRAFWVSLDLPETEPGGENSLEIQVTLRSPWQAAATAKLSLPVRILDYVLPSQRLSCEMWFHGDCLANYYHVKCWTPKYWKLLKNYFTDMGRHGLDTLLTPLWALPLDTRPGHERPAVQLLDIVKNGENYQFDFKKLKRWITLARRAGIRKFSFSHLFTQWGLAATPKIMATVDGVEKRIFGWDVPSNSPEYASFLRQLFEALLPFLRKNNLNPDDVYFHLSDEPVTQHLKKYQECSELVHSMLQGYRTLDALSHVEFFDRGLVDCPVVSESSIENFMDRAIPERWIYYCGEWVNDVPNRKLGMESVRNRILGVLLYLYKMDGFLEWGYNFWFSCESLKQNLDPWNFMEVHSIFGNNGGAFAVYPGKDGKPVPTLYYEVFADALQDLRALQLLENTIGREATVTFLQEGIEYPITLHKWPKDPQWLLQLRQRIAKRLDSIPAK